MKSPVSNSADFLAPLSRKIRGVFVLVRLRPYKSSYAFLFDDREIAMVAKTLVRELSVRDLAGEVVKGKHYRRAIDASDDGGKDVVIDDILELEDGRIAFRAGGEWQDEDDPSSVFKEIG